MNLQGTNKILCSFALANLTTTISSWIKVSSEVSPSYPPYEACNNQRARFFQSNGTVDTTTRRNFTWKLYQNAGERKKRNRSFPIIARCAGLSFKSPSQASDTFDPYILDKSDQPWGPRIDSRKPTFAFRKTLDSLPSHIHRYIRSLFFSLSSSGNQSRRLFIRVRAAPPIQQRGERHDTIRWKVVKKNDPYVVDSFSMARWALLVIRMIDISVRSLDRPSLSLSILSLPYFSFFLPLFVFIHARGIPSVYEFLKIAGPPGR